MSAILLQGGHLITPVEERLTDLFVVDGRLKFPKDRKDVEGVNCRKIDVSNSYVTPGLIDLQVNGGGNLSLWADPTREEFERFTSELLSNGVTCFYPTLITDRLDHLKKNIGLLESFGAGQAGGQGRRRIKIHMPGIHLEGPFISKERPGVHPKEAIIPITNESLKELLTPSVKLITLAPEQAGGQAALEILKEKGVVISLGHSNASFEQAQIAFQNGVSMMTHTFNALPPIHHRNPGAVTAALLDPNVWCCFICDGLHLDRNVVLLALRLKGLGRAILVTDIATVGTAGGGLVGSSIFLNQAVKNLVEWKITSFREAIQMATLNPAAALGIANQFGLLQDGYCADLIVWDKSTFKIQKVLVAGEIAYEA
jgi:N-acetylglucosamine-6-phosphate deacetylase